MRRWTMAISVTSDPLVDGVSRYLLERIHSQDDITEELEYLLDSWRTIVALANEIVGSKDDSYCPMDIGPHGAKSKLLEACEARLIHWPPKYHGLSKMRSKLRNVAEDIDEADPSSISEESLKHYATIGWTYLEDVLRYAIQFYYYFLESEQNDSGLLESFRRVRVADTLSGRLDAIINLQAEFNKKEIVRKSPSEVYTDEERTGLNLYERERQLFQWHFGRCTPFEGFLDDVVEVDLESIPQGLKQSLEEKDPGIHSTKRRSQPGPPKTQRINWYKSAISYYRNYYSHGRSWVAAGVERAKGSFQQAREIIDRFTSPELGIMPVMIVPIEDGYDGFGRRIVRFVHEKDIDDNCSFRREKIRYLYANRNQDIQLHRFHFCLQPANSRMIVPYLIKVESVLE